MISPDPRNAVLLVNKPSGITSNQLVGKMKKELGVKKVGHSGTLDKFASGLMILCTGRFTRLTQFFLSHDKKYRARIVFGVETDTCDPEGTTVFTGDTASLNDDRLAAACKSFAGVIDQVPPAYSALKIQGNRASDLVRQGKDVALISRQVEIFSLQCDRYDSVQREALLHIHCSKGTYIRAIARDLGRILETGAFVAALERTASGPFSLDMIHHDSERELSYSVLAPAQALEFMNTVVLLQSGLEKIRHGCRFLPEDVASFDYWGEGPWRVIDEQGALVSVADTDKSFRKINYHAVFNG